MRDNLMYAKPASIFKLPRAAKGLLCALLFLLAVSPVQVCREPPAARCDDGVIT
jgi:hypothetical protein